MNRRDLLTLTPPSPSPKQQQDSSGAERTTTGLTPYSGSWTIAEVKHLLRRVMFGATKADVDYFVNAGFNNTITELLTLPGTPPSPPLNNYSSLYNDPNVPAGQPWVTAPVDPNATGLRTRSFKAWWAGVMLNQARNIQEKMTLFWSNHFSTETVVVQDPRYSYKTNALCRQYALGNFKTLTKQITLDPGMLKYLNGYLNTATAPDENYGRELQELFTVGKDETGAPYYSESDVQQAARVLTGYRINATTIASFFASNMHDTGNKQFSAFYGNTIITGQSGPNGALELDDLLNMIFATNQVALFVCRKLYRYFVYYEIDSAAETNVIVPLADIFRNNNYNIYPVLDTLLRSEHFFDVLNRGAIIKMPLDVTVATCRDYGVVFPLASDLVGQYNMWFRINQQASLMNQSIGDPPNVAGWPAYHQEPDYHELWINTSSLPNRNLFTDTMLYNGFTTSGDTIEIDIVAYTGTLTTPADPNLLIQEVIDRHYSTDVSQALKDHLKSILLGGTSLPDYYWTNAWNDYIGAPTNVTYYTIVQTRLRTMFKYIMNLSEYQLS